MKQFGIRVKEARTAAKMTQDELARKVGYTTRSSIAKIEKGETDISTKRISRIAKALNVKESWLLGIENGDDMDRKELLFWYDELDSVGRAALLATARSLADQFSQRRNKQ